MPWLRWLPRPRWRAALVGGCCIAALASPARATGQESKPPRARHIPWALIDAIGYGGAGFGVGLATMWSSDRSIGEAVGIIGSSTVAGIVLGAALGHKASAAVAGGRAPRPGLRSAALAGVVLAGASLGALAAVPLINGADEGTPLGSDEATVAITTGIGAAVGILFAVVGARPLPASARVSVAPFVAARGRPGIRVGMTF